MKMTFLAFATEKWNEFVTATGDAGFGCVALLQHRKFRNPVRLVFQAISGRKILSTCSIAQDSGQPKAMFPGTVHCGLITRIRVPPDTTGRIVPQDTL